MKVFKKRYITALILLFVFILNGCGSDHGANASDPQEEVHISEGVDTPITITGYTEFGGEGDYFLKEGDKIAVIAPSALPGSEKVKETVEGLRSLGYVPVEGNYVSVEERTLENCMEDLEWALTDPEIRAVFCVRGGYGATEVMDRLPLSLIQEADKPIIGFSDITAYHSAWTVEDLASIHSSMSAVFTEFPADCADAVKKILQGEVPAYSCAGSEYDIKGSAEGVLIGGNLATLTAVLETDYDCTALDQPFILFLEEIGEDYEHIHRFLTILKHRGVLDRAEGIVFGEWADYPEYCETYSGNSRGGEFESAADMISREFLADTDIPVAFGFPAGHGERNYPLLMGAVVRLDVGEDGYSLEWLRKSF